MRRVRQRQLLSPRASLPRYGPPLEETLTRREAGAEMQESGPLAAVAVEVAPEPRVAAPENYTSSVWRVIKNSGIYAIAAMGGPLVSLIMMPYIAQHVSSSDYGLLSLLNTSIALMAGITALGLGSAFFRTYNYEVEEASARRAVLATVTLLLMLFTVPVAVLAMVFSTQVATTFLGNPADGKYVALAAGVVIVQNLTIPGLSWMRAESRAPFYVALAMTNLLVTLGATVMLVGPLNLGIAGALVGNGAGYLALDAVALPFVLARGGLRVRPAIAWSLVSFGAPQVLSLISYWFLQVSDRYLLAAFTTLSEVARYAAAYTLGSVLGTVLINPFQLAWPTLMYAIAKRDGAGRTYARIFSYYGLVLLLGAFGLGLAGPIALRILFPASYANAAPVIPPVALALALYGFYMYFMLGSSVQRVLWMAPVFVTMAALLNIGANLMLIPLFGSMGAAWSTLAAYMLLAGLAYVANQRIYPIPYRRAPIVVALVLGVVLIAAADALEATFNASARFSLQLVISGGAVAAYLVVVGLLVLSLRIADRSEVRQVVPQVSMPVQNGGMAMQSPTTTITDRSTHLKGRERATRVCMHVLGTARTDGRVMREARALVAAGYDVTIVDIESDTSRPRREDLDGVHLKHVFYPGRYKSVRFKPFFLVKLARMFQKSTGAVIATKADVYHAHDDTGLLPAYLAARLRRKPLVFDAHEIPLVEPRVTRYKRLCGLARISVRAMMPRCTAVITVSPPIVQDLQERYGAKPATLVRNVPDYQPPIESNRLREHMGLGPETRIALYQGNLQEDRGLDVLVRAAQYLPTDNMIVLMGNGGARAGLERLASELGVSDRLTILPAVPYAELLTWTASADAGLILYPESHSPNVRYCLPNKLFEYIMAGIPVVASQLVAVAEILQTYQNGYIVEDLSPEPLGRVIARILAEPQPLRQMRLQAREAARTDLNWEVEQQQLVGLYRRVLAK